MAERPMEHFTVDGVNIFEVTDAKARQDVSNLKEDFSDISERKSTGNIFDPSYLVSSAGWTKDGEDYYGTAKQATDAFGTSPYYPVNCDPSKRYVLSFKAMTPNTGGYSGIGLAIAFVYSDGSSNQVGLPNNTNEYTTFTLVSSDSTAQHGGITAIKFGYSSGGVNVWHMKEITLNEGTTPVDYYGELTAVDEDAREGLAVLRKDFDEKTSNIRMPCINFQFDDGAANDANIVSIFNSHGFTCGFAIVSNMSASDVSRYLEYQASGYEMICHADNGTGMADATVSPETIENRLSSSKSVLESYGFKINGFVTPNSTMARIFKPILRKYYQWAETEYFGSYIGTGKPYMKPIDGVYNGWRVSLQSTTLANQKAAVDAAIENYGCLTFYGHSAAMDGSDNLTTANLNALLSYIQTKISAGKCIIGNPSEVIRNYYAVRNDDVSDGWVDVTFTDASLDERFSVNSWHMMYNEKLGLLWFAVRVAPTEAVSGQIPLFTFPKSVIENQMVLNESGRVAFSYGGKLLITGSNTWAQGTNYRFSGMLKLS